MTDWRDGSVMIKRNSIAAISYHLILPYSFLIEVTFCEMTIKLINVPLVISIQHSTCSPMVEGEPHEIAQLDTCSLRPSRRPGYSQNFQLFFGIRPVLFSNRYQNTMQQRENYIIFTLSVLIDTDTEMNCCKESSQK